MLEKGETYKSIWNYAFSEGLKSEFSTIFPKFQLVVSFFLHLSQRYGPSSGKRERDSVSLFPAAGQDLIPSVLTDADATYYRTF